MIVMAKTAKPIRDLEKKFFRTRKRLNHWHIGKKEIPYVGGRREHFILVKRKPIKVDFYTWAIWFEHSNARRIKQTKLPGDVRVSTVFIGIDSRELFETMIFGGEHDQYQQRSYSYEAALAEHQLAIQECFKVL